MERDLCLLPLHENLDEDLVLDRGDLDRFREYGENDLLCVNEETGLEGEDRKSVLF